MHLWHHVIRDSELTILVAIWHDTHSLHLVQDTYSSSIVRLPVFPLPWQTEDTAMSKKKPDALRRRFGQRVRALRMSAGLSQMDLGGQAGLDHTYIGGIERGERNLSLEAIGKLAAGLGVEMVDLFRFPGHKAVADPYLSELVVLLEKGDASNLRHLNT